MVLVCLTGQQTHQAWTPENLWGIVKSKMRNKRPKTDELKATVKETWASTPPQQCHKLITSTPRWIEEVIISKRSPYQVVSNKLTLLRHSNLLRCTFRALHGPTPCSTAYQNSPPESHPSSRIFCCFSASLKIRIKSKCYENKVEILRE